MSLAPIEAGCFNFVPFRKLFRRRNVNLKAPVYANSSCDKVSSNNTFCGCNEYDWVLEKDALPAYESPNLKNLVSSDNTEIPRSKVKKTIDTELDHLSSALRDLSLKIHSKPELGFQEVNTCNLLTKFMEKQGFVVTTNYCGLETAWRAEYTWGSGGRVLGTNSEMDALPKLGHACGHNLNAITGVGIAVAVKKALEVHKVSGKVIVLGTPAEEAGGGKITLLEAEAYKDMDVCVMSHPAPGLKDSVSHVRTNALQAVVVEYLGKPAHAAALPWEGKNALDAAVLAYSSISALRQQLKPELRVHGIIEGRDWAPNIIPDYSKLSYLIRGPSPVEVDETVARVKGCFKGAAEATGCAMNFEIKQNYYDLRQNPVLAEDFSGNVTQYELSTQPCDFGASTDFGNVSYVLPSLHPMYAIPTEPGGGNHTAEFAESARSIEAHEAAMKVMKGLALTGFRVLSDDKFSEDVRKAFEEDKLSRSVPNIRTP